MSGICCLHRCSRILALRCPFCENTKKATKNPTARPTKGTRRATVPPKPPLKAHMHIVTHLVHLQPRAIIRQIVRQCTWEFRLPTSRDEKKRRYPEMNQSSDVRHGEGPYEPGTTAVWSTRACSSWDTAAPRSRIKFSWPPSVGIYKTA